MAVRGTSAASSAAATTTAAAGAHAPRWSTAAGIRRRGRNATATAADATINPKITIRVRARRASVAVTGSRGARAGRGLDRLRRGWSRRGRLHRGEPLGAQPAGPRVVDRGELLQAGSP